MKKGMSYFKKNPIFSAVVHSLAGIGVGILIASPIAGSHPVRWGLVFIVLAIIGHIYAWIA